VKYRIENLSINCGKDRNNFSKHWGLISKCIKNLYSGWCFIRGGDRLIKDSEEVVVLVDKFDKEIGTCEKLKAHVEGRLHRAFSVFVFNSKRELLLQRRAFGKYHSSGLWSNTCCSHPRKSEKIEEAVHRRLLEELGFDCPIKKIFDFCYKAELDNGLYEHEYDHVFIGEYDGEPKPNPKEVDSWMWINLDELLKKIKSSPEEFTYWFKYIINNIVNYLENF